MTDKQQLTLMLKQWQAGDEQALNQLMPEVYQQLRQLASQQLNRGNNSIQCTELISEAYLKLIDIHSMDWRDRTHFYSMAARTMRRVLVDRFRRKNTHKRGNDPTLLTLTEMAEESPKTIQLDELEDALLKLESFDPQLSEIVTLKFYGGLSHQEIAQALSSSERTIRREWAVARLWLNQQLNH